MGPLSVKAEAVLREIEAEGFVQPYRFHACTLRALFNRNLIVATRSKTRGGCDGTWIRLRRNRSESSNAHLAVSHSLLVTGARR